MIFIKTICITCLTLVLGANCVFAQTTELKIGDKLPELLINGVINQKSNDIPLNDLYKGRLLIIDFWATWCQPCIQEMTFLDSLKNKNPDKFNVLMVTYEDKTTIEKFLNKSENKDISTANLVLATGDTVLRSLFKHRAIPHNIWIDSLGTIKAITGPEEITANNILSFNNPAVHDSLKTKKDILDFSPQKEFHLADENFEYRSIITPYIDGLGGGAYGGGKNPKRFFEWNASIFQLFYDAYSLFSQSPSSLIRYNLVEVNTTDSLRIFPPVGKMKSLLKGSNYKTVDEWIVKNSYCYALTLKNRVPNTVFSQYMFDDLERHFGIKGKIENRKVKCLVVTKGKGKPLPVTEESDIKPMVRFIDGGRLLIKASKIDDVMKYLFGSAYSHAETMPNPFIVSINERENLRFSAEFDFSGQPESEDGITPEMVFIKLNEYGFKFETKMRSYPILVMNDRL